MKKPYDNFPKYIFLVLFSFICFKPDLKAQITAAAVEEEFGDRIGFIFQNVNLSKVPSGILAEYGFSLTNLSNYAGVAMHDSNYVDIQNWRYLYMAMDVSRVRTTANFATLESVNQNLTNLPEDGNINLLVQHFHYHTLKSTALSANLMYRVGDQLYDTPGRTSSPYSQKVLFAVAPTEIAFRKSNLSFVFRQSLFYSNTGKTVSKLQIDFGNGAGYKTAQWTVPLTVNYSSTGEKKLRFKITYTDGTVMQSHSKINILELSTAARYENTADEQMIDFPANQLGTFVSSVGRPYAGVAALGNVSIAYGGNGEHQLDRPLIVVEGFDAWHIFNTNDPLDLRGNNYGYRNFINQMNRDLLNTGFDLNNLLDLYGFDLIFLDFRNGTDFIQRNAYLLQRLIEWVNANKVPDDFGVRHQNAVLGISMGGLVARYAIREMEVNPDYLNRNYRHEVELYISMDSPHLGANVPLGFQAMVRHLNTVEIKLGPFAAVRYRLADATPSLKQGLQVLDSPAARQMLIYQCAIATNGNIVHTTNTFYPSFMEEYRNLGIPQGYSQAPVRNIAISSGSECGQRLNFDFNSNLLCLTGQGPNWNLHRLNLLTVTFPYLIGFLISPVGAAIGWVIGLATYGRYDIAVDFSVNALPNQQTAQIYKGKIEIKKKALFGIITVRSTVTDKSLNSLSTMLPLDNAPGGFYDISTFIGQDIRTLLTTGFPFPSNLCGLQNRFSFIPTASSLDVNTINNQALTAIYTAAVSPGNPSSFANFVAQEQYNLGGQTLFNQFHTQFTVRNSQFLLEELQEILGTQGCTDVCTRIPVGISGSSFICGNTNYSIPVFGGSTSYHWVVGNGLQIVSGQGTTQVQIRNVGSFSGNTSIVVNVQGICNVTPISKTVLVNGFNGTGSISSLIYGTSGGNWQYNPGANEMFFANSTAPTTTYEWDISGADILDGQGTDRLSVRIWQISGTEPYYGFVRLTLGNECGQGNPVTASFTIQPGGPVMLSVNPNPASEELQVEIIEQENQAETLSSSPKSPPPGVIPKESASGGFSFRLYNAYGVLTDSFTKEEKRFSVNIRALEAGLYYLHLLYKGKRIAKKVVVER